jgi:hypothetical protein
MKRLLLVVTLFLAACGPNLPAAECDPASQHPDSLLHCDTAVSKALRVLPSDHQTITRVQFLYGSARPYDCGVGLSRTPRPSGCAYVVFTFADKSRQYVNVMGTDEAMTLASPAPY